MRDYAEGILLYSLGGQIRGRKVVGGRDVLLRRAEPRRRSRSSRTTASPMRSGAVSTPSRWSTSWPPFARTLRLAAGRGGRHPRQPRTRPARTGFSERCDVDLPEQAVEALRVDHIGLPAAPRPGARGRARCRTTASRPRGARALPSLAVSSSSSPRTSGGSSATSIAAPRRPTARSSRWIACARYGPATLPSTASASNSTSPSPSTRRVPSGSATKLSSSPSRSGASTSAVASHTRGRGHRGCRGRPTSAWCRAEAARPGPGRSRARAARAAALRAAR